jgi:hypothetical protein
MMRFGKDGNECVDTMSFIPAEASELCYGFF